MRKRPLKASLEKVLGCDLRSLALFRVTIAFILLLDWINRLQNFRAFLSENGLLPRSALAETYGSPFLWSLNFISIGDWWQMTLLITNLFFILCLFVGWNTRWTTVACWVLELSLQAKTPVLMQSGDVLLRLLLFWCIFVPWGAKYSVDAALSAVVAPKRVFSLGTAGLCLQALFVYFFSVFLKWGAPWRVDGTAVYYALNLDHFSTPLGKAMLQLPLSLLKELNFGVLAFEFFAMFLFLIPWGHSWFRPFLILGCWFMHASFGLTLAIGNFVLISISSTMPMIPSETWDWLEGKLSIKAASGKIYFDKDCGLCVKMAAIVREFLFLPKEMFRPAQTDPKIEKLMVKQDSWIYENRDGDKFFETEALRELMAESPVFKYFRILFDIPLVMPLGNLVYRQIAKYRSRDCEIEPQKKNSPLFELSGIENIFVAFMIVFVVLLNIGTVPRPLTRVADNNGALALILRLDQSWEMFSPQPLVEDGWYVIKGKLQGGQEVDLFKNGEPVTYQKPASVADTYTDFRWRKYMVNLWSSKFSRHRLYYSRYLCREWNAHHPPQQQVLNFDIIYMKEDTPPPGEPLPTAVPTVIWNWTCS